MWGVISANYLPEEKYIRKLREKVKEKRNERKKLNAKKQRPLQI